MSNTTTLKTEYKDRIVSSLMKEFGYKSSMQVPVLKKIVINLPAIQKYINDAEIKKFIIVPQKIVNIVV